MEIRRAFFESTGSLKGIKLQVSPNGRYFTDNEGRPFFYLADTAWRLFKALNRQEAVDYLRNRLEKGFTVIQAYVLRGLSVPNLYGELPLIDRDPSRPNEVFFENIDFIVDKAQELGLFMGLVTTFGEHVRRGNVEGEYFESNEAVFTEKKAYEYGCFLGNRYKDKPVIWIFGGDRKPQGSEAVWRAMARGLREGSGGGQLITYHGPGDPNTPSSSFWFHEENWLDFNTIQSGHGWAVPNYLYVEKDYALSPVKPTLDMEPSYEECLDVKYGSGRRTDAHGVREGAYWAMLSGAAGHGYGCLGVWEFNSEKLTPDYTFNYGLWRGTRHWRDAMDSEGAFGMGIMRRLFECYPWYRLIPDNTLIASEPGEGKERSVAARAEDGSFALIYLPVGRGVEIKRSSLSIKPLRFIWFNPRTGEYLNPEDVPEKERAFFLPPGDPEKDWVLVFEIRDR